MPLIESRPLPPRPSLDRGSRPPRRTGSAGRPLLRPGATPAAPRRASLPGASAARFVPGRRVSAPPGAAAVARPACRSLEDRRNGHRERPRARPLRHPSTPRSRAPAAPSRGTVQPSRDWEPPVLATVASTGAGVDELAAALDGHYAYLQASGKLAERRRQRLAARTRAVLERSVRRWLLEGTRVEELLALRLDEVADGRRSPYDVAAEILDQVKAGEGGDAIR